MFIVEHNTITGNQSLMKYMTSAEVRQTFLDYFVEQQHREVMSSSFVPGNDPTLLFANAGATSLERLSDHPRRPLLGFLLDEIDYREDAPGWGEFCLRLVRDGERLTLLVRSVQGFERAYLKTSHLALCHRQDTPPDSRDKEIVVRRLAQVLERCADRIGAQVSPPLQPDR